jgi:hypothetical protein
MFTTVRVRRATRRARQNASTRQPQLNAQPLNLAGLSRVLSIVFLVRSSISDMDIRSEREMRRLFLAMTSRAPDDVPRAAASLRFVAGRRSEKKKKRKKRNKRGK